MFATQRRTAEKIVAAIVLVAATVAHLSAYAPRQNAAQANAKDILDNKCLICHELDVIRQQRLSRTGWTREVDKMIRWGASISDTEKELLLNYLAATFPAQPSPGRAAESAGGKAIFENRCTICHESDIVAGQRLSRSGWTREVDKMVRWGATLDESEKATLIDYLSALYPVR